MTVFALYAASIIGMGLLAGSVWIFINLALPCRVIPRHEDEQPIGDASLLGREP